MVLKSWRNLKRCFIGCEKFQELKSGNAELGRMGCSAFWVCYGHEPGLPLHTRACGVAAVVQAKSLARNHCCSIIKQSALRTALQQEAFTGIDF